MIGLAREQEADDAAARQADGGAGMTRPSISVLVLRHVVHCLDLSGCQVEPLLARHGLRREELDDAHRMMPLADFLAFFEHAAIASSNPHFGLHAGRLGGLNSLGALGFLFLSAPTLRAAFTGFTSYLATIQDAARSRFFAGSGIATFDYAITDQTLQDRRQDAEFSLALVHALCRSYIGADFELVEARFEHPRQGDDRVYRDLFRCPVFFDQDTNAFVFEDRFLDRPGGVIAPDLFPIIEEHLRRRAADGTDGNGTDQARTHREALRLLETSPLDRSPGLEAIAAQLGVSVATLNRQLRAEGVRWRDLVHQRRMNAAARLLRQSRRGVAEIALAVGFSESASFVRSFSRHFGTTPGRYRDGAGTSDSTR